MLKNDIDAYILITVVESGADEEYVPPSEFKRKTEESIEYENHKIIHTEKTTAGYSGGYTIEKPWAEIETKLYDAFKGKVAWIASSFTNGKYYADKEVVLKSYCKKTAEKLIEEKLLLTHKN